MTEEWNRHVKDPAGREVVFDATTHMHLALGLHPEILDHVDQVLATVEQPSFHEDDPYPGRERFYRGGFLVPAHWLVVVVDFNDDPAWIVTAFASKLDPRVRRP